MGGRPQEWRTEVPQLGTVSNWLRGVDLSIARFKVPTVGRSLALVEAIRSAWSKVENVHPGIGTKSRLDPDIRVVTCGRRIHISAVLPAQSCRLGSLGLIDPTLANEVRIGLSMRISATERRDVGCRTDTECRSGIDGQ